MCRGDRPGVQTTAIVLSPHQSEAKRLWPGLGLTVSFSQAVAEEEQRLERDMGAELSRLCAALAEQRTGPAVTAILLGESDSAARAASCPAAALSERGGGGASGEEGRLLDVAPPTSARRQQLWRAGLERQAAALANEARINSCMPAMRAPGITRAPLRNRPRRRGCVASLPTGNGLCCWWRS